jgi:hypothetical protein
LTFDWHFPCGFVPSLSPFLFGGLSDPAITTTPPLLETKYIDDAPFFVDRDDLLDYFPNLNIGGCHKSSPPTASVSYLGITFHYQPAQETSPSAT